MFYALHQYTAILDQTQFIYSFPTTDLSEIIVLVDNVPSVPTTDYTIASGIVTFNTEMLGGEVVVIKRMTDLSTRKVDFNATSLLKEADLDDSAVQFFHAIQEQADSLTLLGG